MLKQDITNNNIAISESMSFN